MHKTVPIKKNSDYLRVYRKGRFFVGKFMILYVLANNSDINRLGIVAGKKIGKSVRRNRIRRLIRENYRLYEDFIKAGYDCVFVARAAGQVPNFFDVKKEMRFLLKKLEIFDMERWDCLKGR